VYYKRSLLTPGKWEKTCGGREAESGYFVQQTADRGFVAAGETRSHGAGDSDVYLVKTDSLGDTLWTRTYGGINDDHARCVRQTHDGGYVLCGYTSSFGSGSRDVYVVRTDSRGDTLWTRCYGGAQEDLSYSVEETPDGGVILAGYTGSFGAGYYDAYVIKTDSLGDTVWTRTYGGARSDWGRCISHTADGGYILVGYTESFGAGHFDIWLVRLDSFGDTLWTRVYGDSLTDYPYSVQETQDGGFIVCGSTDSRGAGSYDVYLLKTDSQGDTLWSKTFGGPAWDYGRCARRTLDGGYVICGYTESHGSGSFDIWVIRTDSLGDTLWTRTFGGDAADLGRWIEQSRDGGYIAVGSTNSYGAGASDIYLLKLPPDGSPVLQVDRSSFDVTVPLGADTTEIMTVSNPGNAPLIWSLFENPEVEWLASSPMAGILDPGFNEEVRVTLDTGELAPGTYETSLVVCSNDSGQDTATVPVSLTVVPEVDLMLAVLTPTVPRGGSLRYRARVVNNTSDTKAFEYWSRVQLPDSTWRDVLPPQPIVLTPFQVREQTLRHRVPGNARVGEYLYAGFAGQVPDSIWDQDSFDFTVTAEGHVTKPGLKKTKTGTGR
jgi:hypothetical protein